MILLNSIISQRRLACAMAPRFSPAELGYALSRHEDGWGPVRLHGGERVGGELDSACGRVERAPGQDRTAHARPTRGRVAEGVRTPEGLAEADGPDARRRVRPPQRQESRRRVRHRRTTARRVRGSALCSWPRGV